jgi:hypothetical protein
MRIKVYRNKTRIIVPFALFLLLAVASIQFLGEVFQWKNGIVLAPLVFFLGGFILFEFQKSTLLKSLAGRILPKGEPYCGFIFDDEIKQDPFENFLIVSRNKIIICTAYLDIQAKYNRLIGKKSGIRILEKEKIGSIAIDHSSFRVEITSGDGIIEIKNCPHIPELITMLKNYQYPL